MAGGMGHVPRRKRLVLLSSLLIAALGSLGLGLWLYYGLAGEEPLIDSLGVEVARTRPHDGLRPSSTSLEGHARCNRATLTCLFTNLRYHPVSRHLFIYTSMPSTMLNESGALMLPGIGSPSNYYYLDTWTHGDAAIRTSSQVQDALHRLAVERNHTAPERRFIPIYVKPMSRRQADGDDGTVRRIDEATMMFSVLWPRNLFRVLYAGAAALFSLYEWDAIGNPTATTATRIVLFDDSRTIKGDGHGHGDPLSRLYRAFNPTREIIVLDRLEEPVVFGAAVVGLSRAALLSETTLDFSDSMSSIRASSYRLYASLTRRWLFSRKEVEEVEEVEEEEVVVVEEEEEEEEKKVEGSPVLPSRGEQMRNSTLYERIHQSRLWGMQGPATALHMVLVIRRDDRRRILNLAALLATLRGLSLTLRVVAFEDYSLAEQIRIVQRADILVAVHGAALSHLFFMRTETAVIEIFPYGFHKTIYRNLAAVVGVQYASWQCPRSSCSTLDEAVAAPLDWESQESKDRWRNQDVRVDLVEFAAVLDLVMKHVRSRTVLNPLGSSPRIDNPREMVLGSSASRGEQYLMYLPWEQFNNQLVGFKSACAVAHFLNRTLVLPPIGHRKPLPSPVLEERLAHMVRVFAPREYEWRPWTRYFDSSMVVGLPCRTTPFAAFTSLTRRVRALLMRRLGQSARVNSAQLQDFYFYVAGLEYEKAAPLPAYYPLYFDRADIDRFLAKRYSRDRVLCLGTMFWIYSFGAPLEFPARSFQSRMADPLYRQITAAFRPHADLLLLYARLRTRLGSSAWNAIHLRRGDYAQKCYDEGMGASQEPLVLRSCFQRPAYLAQRIRAIQRGQPQRIPCFMASNDRKLRKLQDIFRRLGIRLVTLDDLLGEEVQRGPWRSLDPVEWSILDQLMCIHAHEFIGNYFSSFTRTIVDHRDLLNKTSQFF